MAFGSLKGSGSVPPRPPPLGVAAPCRGFEGLHWPGPGLAEGGVSWGHSPRAVWGGDAEDTASSRAGTRCAFSEPNFCVGRRDDSREPLPQRWLQTGRLPTPRLVRPEERLLNGREDRAASHRWDELQDVGLRRGKAWRRHRRRTRAAPAQLGCPSFQKRRFSRQSEGGPHRTGRAVYPQTSVSFLRVSFLHRLEGLVKRVRFSDE